MEGMRLVSRHDDHLTFLEQVFSLFNGDFRFAINNRGNCIKRCGMFRQAFAGFEGKKSDGPALFVHDHAADYGTILVGYQVFWIRDLSGKVFMGFFWHGNQRSMILVRPFIKTYFKGPL